MGEAEEGIECDQLHGRQRVLAKVGKLDEVDSFEQVFVVVADGVFVARVKTTDVFAADPLLIAEKEAAVAVEGTRGKAADQKEATVSFHENGAIGQNLGDFWFS